MTFLHEKKVVPDFLKNERKKQGKIEENGKDFFLAGNERIGFVRGEVGKSFF